MIICDYCGQVIDNIAGRCPHCGAQVTIVPTQTESGTSYTTVTTPAVADEQTADNSGSGDYKVILASLGSCDPSAADDLLVDILGYAEAEAPELVSLVPAIVAENLSLKQAKYLAQALTEYGMTTSIRNSDGYVETFDDDDDSSSVFDSSGNFLSNVLAAFTGLSAANQVKKRSRFSLTNLLGNLFKPKYKRPVPPPHMRRTDIHPRQGQPGQPPMGARPQQPPQMGSRPQGHDRRTESRRNPGDRHK